MCDFTDFALLATLDTIPVLKTPFEESFRLCAECKRVFGYMRHVQSDKREFKESFSNMSAPMVS